MFDKPYLQKSNPYKSIIFDDSINRTIYYGEVISTDDLTDGGRIRVRIPGLDDEISNENLEWCFPMLQKFFHVHPKPGEMVRIFIENMKYPQRSRFWLGPIISQLHRIDYDGIYSALSTTNMALVQPDKAPSTFPDAKGVYPEKEDIAILGRINNDIILRGNETHIRTGKHFDGDVLRLNTQNPSILSQVFEDVGGEMRSSTVVLSDKIAIISHDGRPKFKATELNKEDRDRIFETGHPMVRGDVLTKALDIIRKAIILHIHGYSGIPADKDAIIKELENLNFEQILQKNIVIN